MGDFDHSQFVHADGNKRPNPVAFCRLGDGTLLCQGLHFASAEILVFAALLILHFDVQPVSGKWNRPTADKAAMWATMPAPDVDVDFEFRPRDDRKLNVTFSGSNKGMRIAAENLATDEK